MVVSPASTPASACCEKKLNVMAGATTFTPLGDFRDRRRRLRRRRRRRRRGWPSRSSWRCCASPRYNSCIATIATRSRRRHRRRRMPIPLLLDACSVVEWATASIVIARLRSRPRSPTTTSYFPPHHLLRDRPTFVPSPGGHHLLLHCHRRRRRLLPRRSSSPPTIPTTAVLPRGTVTTMTLPVSPTTPLGMVLRRTSALPSHQRRDTVQVNRRSRRRLYPPPSRMAVRSTHSPIGYR